MEVVSDFFFVMWSRVHRSQCLGTGIPSWNDKKKRYWYDIKRVGVDGKKKHRRHSASFFVIPARDAGIHEYKNDE